MRWEKIVTKKTVKVKSHYKTGNEMIDKLATNISWIKTKKIKEYSRKPSKKKNLIGCS